MGIDNGKFYKHSQSQLPTLSFKVPVSSSLDPQNSSATELTKKSVPSVAEKNQNNYVLYSQNTNQNDATITNNDNIQSCEIEKNQNYSIPKISTHNNYTQCIATTSSCILKFKHTYNITSGL